MHLSHVVTLTMLIANVSVPGTDADVIAQGRVEEACALFTLEEAGKATGRTFRRARPEKQPGGTTCALIGGTGGNLNVTLSPATSKKTLDDFRKLLIEQGEKPEAVSGIGDEAFYWGDRIHVLTGSQLLVIWNGDSSQPSPRARAEVLALAKLAVSKLKG